MTDEQRGPICLSCNKQADIDIYEEGKYTGASYCSYACLQHDAPRLAELYDDRRKLKYWLTKATRVGP